jgi:hypothetical protein
MDEESGTGTFPGGAAKCPAGKIRRSGYTATRRAKGLFGKLRGTKYTVKSTCVKDVGKPGHGEPLIGKLKKGDLTEVGYAHTHSASSRHESLAKAVAKFGRLSTLRKLNAIATLTKNTAPSRSMTYRTDRNYVIKHF